jgi:hypothetical protein
MPLVLLACLFFLSHQMVAQEVKVVVLDALDGKPQAKVEVEYFCTRPQHNSAHKNAVTDNEGAANFANLCRDDQDIEIAIYSPNKKEQCGVGTISLRDILSVGFVSKPDSAGGIWCPARVSKTLKPVPGQVIMFVKKPTWWQSHIAP